MTIQREAKIVRLYYERITAMTRDCRAVGKAVATLFVVVAALFAMHLLSGAASDGSRQCGAVAAERDDLGASATGAVEGIVIYDADRRRSWRYRRYYVAGRGTGPLAEAVVGLSGAALSELRPPTRAATATIDQKDYRFIPETIAVRAGDKIRFTNSDPLLHDVSSHGQPQRFSFTLNRGDHELKTFDRAGGMRQPIQLGCRFHSAMRGWIFVFDHPFFAVTEAEGHFRMEAVPAGKYHLEVVHPAGQLRYGQEIEVAAGETLTLELHLSPDHLIQSTE